MVVGGQRHAPAAYIGGWVDPRASLDGCHIVIWGLPRSTLFFHISHKWHEFRKTFIEHKICILIFSTTS